MTNDQGDGHVFISYVREDDPRVDRLERVLKGANIPYWRDKNDIAPGKDWRLEIKRAIDGGALAFLACFSKNSESKSSTYQREELILAVEQLRRMAPGETWLIPIRFDDCELPYYEIGPNRDLDSLNRVDLFEGDWENTGRLTKAILGVLGSKEVAIATPPQTSDAELRQMLLDPAKEIAVEDLVNQAVSRARAKFADTSLFPHQSARLNPGADAYEFLAEQLELYSTTLTEILPMLMVGGAYGKEWHEGLWARSMQRLGSTAEEVLGGMTVLLNLRKLPVCLAIYATSLGAVHRSNWGALRAVTSDAKFKDNGIHEPMISQAHPWRPFEGHGELAELAMENLERRRRGETERLVEPKNKRRTPMSDYIAAELSPIFMDLFHADEKEFYAAFDGSEVWLGWLTEHASIEAKVTANRYLHRAWPGAFTWRDGWREPRLEQRIVAEAPDPDSSSAWPPVEAGLFGGSGLAANEAGKAYLESMGNARDRMPWS